MKNDKNTTKSFLEGESTIEEMIHLLKDNEESVVFLKAYHKAFGKSGDEIPEDFDPLAKVAQHIKDSRVKLTRRISIAASIAALTVIVSVAFFRTNREPIRYTQLTKKELIQLNNTTAKTLYYFSREMNKNLKQLEDVNLLEKPLQSMRTLRETNIGH